MKDRKIFLDLFEVKMKNNIMITVNAERYEVHKNIRPPFPSIIVIYKRKE